MEIELIGGPADGVVYEVSEGCCALTVPYYTSELFGGAIGRPFEPWPYTALVYRQSASDPKKFVYSGGR